MFPKFHNSRLICQRRLNRLASRGFTMLELMVVITIMMILMAIAVPAYQHHLT